MKNELDETEWSLEESRKSWVAARDRALKAQWENADLVRQHGDELQERNDKDTFVETVARPGFAEWFGVAPVVDDELRNFVAADILRHAA